jgi:GT2 family glycosyltransferase
MPDVSVVIVNWNTLKYICDCLNSLLRAGKGYTREIIVVDNASCDGSADVVARQFPGVSVIRNAENVGFARANNIGIRRAAGRYICIVNPDVVVRDGCIENLMRFMDQNPGVGIAGPRILNSDGSVQISCRHFPTIWNNLCQSLGLNRLFPKSAFFSDWLMSYWPHDGIRSVDVLSGCFWIVRREAINQVGLLDEDFFIYGEDIDWCRRFHKAGWDVMFYPESAVIHFGGGSSSKAPIKFYIEMQKADLHYWEKHHGAVGRASYAGVIFFRHLLRLIFMALQYLVYPSRRKTASFKLKRSFTCIKWILHLKCDLEHDTFAA